MNNKNIFDEALHQVFELDIQCKGELEKYIYYMARCLKEKFNLNDIVVIYYDEPDGIRQAVTYPKSSVINGKGVVNPLFYKGYSLTITDEGIIKIFFTENPEQLQ